MRPLYGDCERNVASAFPRRMFVRTKSRTTYWTGGEHPITVRVPQCAYENKQYHRLSASRRFVSPKLLALEKLTGLLPINALVYADSLQEPHNCDAIKPAFLPDRDR